jgi:hypothetical protein
LLCLTLAFAVSLFIASGMIIGAASVGRTDSYCRPFEELGDLLDELTKSKRFWQEAVNTHIHRASYFMVLKVPGHRQDEKLGTQFAKATNDVEAVVVGKPNIHDGHVRGHRIELSDAVLSGCCVEHGVSIQFQYASDQTAERIRIFDEKNGRHDGTRGYHVVEHVD